MKEFRTVYTEGQFELVEKKSRFICAVKRVSDEQQALDFISRISAAHRDANHNVYAYIVESETVSQRYSDDKEPQGTAGIPVLAVLRREGLKNVCVVVTRYFGGTLLGASGLIRAYSAAARGGLREAEICTMALYYRTGIKLSYGLLGKVRRALQDLNDEMIGAEYGEDVRLLVKVRYDRLDATSKAVENISSGASRIERMDSFFDRY